MWQNPTEIDDEILNFCRLLSCDLVSAVLVKSETAYDYDNCHNNTYVHSTIYGGNSVIGWYIIKGFNTLQAIRHTVWFNGIEYVDITPYKDNRNYIIFGRSRNQIKDYSIPNCYLHSLDKYLNNAEQESVVSYYVYQLVDPRNNMPFYIGKGKGRRAITHLWDIPETRNQYKENKIADIRAAGLEPVIVYVAENIIDENLAYDIETSLIKKYGRKGYDTNGILTNVCIDNRPPNHKGKSYEDIYGIERAVEQRKLRSYLQKERGGYGPKQHTDITKKKISNAVKGTNNPRYGAIIKGTDIANKISKSNTGKKHYFRSKLVCIKNVIDDTTYFLYKNDLSTFCNNNKFSKSTFEAQLRYNWPASKYGMNKNMLIRYATDDEIKNYITQHNTL